MENPFPPSRADVFPAGLRVLIVDDDPTWLKILEKMLRKCSYEVTTCSLATEALDMLRERKDRFDIVISDVNMPDMDGFKLLEHVGLEMDLPVIMMSIDGETSRVMKGVQHGACDYLLKPVRMKELRNIWQHVYRKKMHELKEMEVHNIHEEFSILGNGYEDLEERQLIGGTEMNATRKRKDADNKELGDQEFNDPSTVKKARVVWSVDLHQKFVDAVNQIGFDKVGPKKILDLMNVPRLTRENVASHLQKYRLYLSRIQKQNEGRTCSGNMTSDLINNDNRENFGLHSSSSIQEDIELTKYVCATENFQTQGIVPNAHTNETKRKLSVQEVGSKKNLSNDTCNQKANNVPQLGVLLSFKGMMPSIKERSCDPVTPKHKPLHDATARMQFMQNTKQENCNKFSDFSCLSNLDQNHPSFFDHLSSPLPSVISSTCTDEKDLCEMKHFLTDYRNGHFTTIPPMACMIDSVSLQVKHGIVNSQDIGAICKLDGPLGIEDCYRNEPYNQGCFPLTCEFSLKSEAEIDSFADDLHLCSVQKIGCFENVSISGTEIYQYINSTATTEVQNNWNTGSELLGEYVDDLVDYLPMDEYLFA